MVGDLFTTPSLIFFALLLDLDPRSIDLRDPGAVNSFQCIDLQEVRYFSRHCCVFPFGDITVVSELLLGTACASIDELKPTCI